MFCQTEGVSEFRLPSNEFHTKERFPNEFYPGVCLISCLHNFNI